MLVRMGSNRNSHSLVVGMKNSTATFKDSLAVSYKTKHTLTMLSSNCAPCYSIYTKKLKTYVHTKTYTWKFIAALFTCAKLEINKVVLR